MNARLTVFFCILCFAVGQDWGQPPPPVPPKTGCTWRIGSPRPCSVTCGSGVQLRHTTLTGVFGDTGAGVNCTDSVTGIWEIYTNKSVGVVKTQSMVCNGPECPVAGCSTTCQPGIGMSSCHSFYDEATLTHKALCLCKPGWTGPQCTTQNGSLCLGTDCGNGTCIVFGHNNSQACKCANGMYQGSACKTPVCTGCQLDNTVPGDQCSLDDDGSVICNCKGTWGGEFCDLRKIPAQPCAPGRCNEPSGLCMDTSTFGMEFCVCKVGYVGPNCEKLGTVQSQCKPLSVMNCILSAPTGNDKCAAIDDYIECAKANNCNDMITAWCATGVPGCPGRASKCPTQQVGTCNGTIYQACFAELRRNVDDDPRVYTQNCIPASYARCAAAASCPDLLNSYCGKNMKPCGNATVTMPIECGNLDQANPQGLLEHPHHAALGSGKHLGKLHEHKMTLKASTFLVGGAGIFVVVSVLAVVAIRRRRASAAIVQGDYEMM